MRNRTAICGAVAAATALVTAAPAMAQATGQVRLATFAGYATTGHYRAVSATFTVPRQRCAGVQARGASIGVGLGNPGPNSDRAGIAVTCINGHAADYAYAVVPGPFGGIGAPSAVAHAGDVIQVSVSDSKNTLTLSVTDVTAHWGIGDLTGPANITAPVEAGVQHTYLHGVLLPLVNFGSVRFTSARTGSAAFGAIATNRITMASGATVQAAPSALSGSGSFTVSWRHS